MCVHVCVCVGVGWNVCVDRCMEVDQCGVCAMCR